MKYSATIRNRLSVFGYYQIIGGIIGIGLITWLLISLSNFNSFLLAIIIPAFLLFLFSIYCGYLLLKNKESGIKFSVINQCLQLIGFAMGGYAFQYVSGLYLTIGLDFTDSFTFMFGFGISTWRLNINTGDPFLLLDINVAALVVIIMLYDLKKKMKAAQNSFLFEETEPST